MENARMKRYWHNLTTTAFALRRAFPAQVLEEIEAAIRASEVRHGGEVQFAIECALSFRDLWRGVTPRDQAIRAFADLRVWDTRHNNGVLIYVLLAGHAIEIVADRGYQGSVTEGEWRGICVEMQREFAAGRFRDGAVAAIDAVTTIIAAEYPRETGDVDERPNRPVIL
jgi:uncharacterized membrane protein